MKRRSRTGTTGSATRWTRNVVSRVQRRRPTAITSRRSQPCRLLALFVIRNLSRLRGEKQTLIRGGAEWFGSV